MKKSYKWLAVGVTGALFATASMAAYPLSASAAASNTLSWSGTSDPSLKGQTITVLWSDTQGPKGPRATLLKEFTKDTGIKVKEIAVQYNSIYDKVMTAAMSNSSNIDVAEMDTIWAGQYYAGHVAVDLSTIAPKSYWNQFTNSSLGSVTYNGHVMGMPWFSSSKHFYWNMKMLKKAGISAPPKTWDQFLTDSKIIQKKLPGVYASGWSWKQAESLTCDYVGMVGAFGGQVFDKNGKPAFNSGGGLKALQYMSTLVKDKLVDPASLQWTENDVTNAFEAGKIAMMSNWEGEYPALNDPKQSKVVGQSEVGLLPGEGKVVSASCTGSEGVAILQSSQHKEAALAFLKWIASKQYQLGEFKLEGQYPSLTSLYSTKALKAADSSHTLAKIEAQFKYGINRPNAPGYVSWSDQLSAALHQALLGQVTPKTALNNAVNAINQAMQQQNQ